MKTLTIVPIIVAILLLLLSKIVSANTDPYMEVMQKTILAVYNAKTAEEFQTAANTFHRIAEAEKTKWEPFYYEAYGYVIMATQETEAKKKDAFLDQALQAVESAKKIQENESEIVAMEGFVHMIRVTVDPASRGQLYSGLAFQQFNKAVAMNPENPRALILQAQMEYGTAQFFGAPVTEACATVRKAVEKFDTFKSDNPLAPAWGKSMADRLKSQCP